MEIFPIKYSCSAQNHNVHELEKNISWIQIVCYKMIFDREESSYVNVKKDIKQAAHMITSSHGTFLLSAHLPKKIAMHIKCFINFSIVNFFSSNTSIQFKWNRNRQVSKIVF